MYAWDCDGNVDAEDERKALFAASLTIPCEEVMDASETDWLDTVNGVDAPVRHFSQSLQR